MHDPLREEIDDLNRRLREKDVLIEELRDEVTRLGDAIRQHHAQKADDRCVEDDDRLYAAAGLPPCDRRVGDKAAMLKNCERFIINRCEGGHWPSYVELEEEVSRLKAALVSAYDRTAAQSELLSRRAERTKSVSIEDVTMPSKDVTNCDEGGTTVVTIREALFLTRIVIDAVRDEVMFRMWCKPYGHLFTPVSPFRPRSTCTRCGRVNPDDTD